MSGEEVVTSPEPNYDSEKSAGTLFPQRNGTLLTVPVDSFDPNQSLLHNLAIVAWKTPNYLEHPHDKPLLLVQGNFWGNCISEAVGERADRRKQLVELVVGGLLQYLTLFRFLRTWSMKEIVVRNVCFSFLASLRTQN